jgi:DUF1680 family protein
LARRLYFFPAHDSQVSGNSSVISGKVWKFGDNINTDLMLPGPLLNDKGSSNRGRRAISRRPMVAWVCAADPVFRAQ